jgi:hypothetical protein
LCPLRPADDPLAEEHEASSMWVIPVFSAFTPQAERLDALCKLLEQRSRLLAGVSGEEHQVICLWRVPTYAESNAGNAVFGGILAECSA